MNSQNTFDFGEYFHKPTPLFEAVKLLFKATETNINLSGIGYNKFYDIKKVLIYFITACPKSYDVIK